MIRSLDTQALANAYRTAKPFPFVCVDNFLDESFVREVARSYPDFSTARAQGYMFKAVNEHHKIQTTDYTKFPDAVKRLADYCASEEFRNFLTQVTGIRNLLWDPGFTGGGMHQTAAHGWLDVHVDFNRLENQLYRRVNLLLYLNEEWNEEWGGRLELWDRSVKKCHHSIAPALNRCVIFETSGISFHGVTALTCPPDMARRSFALYFYTKEAPSEAARAAHSTIFRARPHEHLKRYVLMPAERVQRATTEAKRVAGRVADKVRRVLARD
jgi:hypothetical protein